MKCYQHPEVDAVARCSVCGRLLCRECTVQLEGKRYCKQHAERILVREDRVSSLRRRGFSINLASVLAVLDGLAGVVVGFLLILLGLLAPSAQGSPILATTVEPFLNYFASVLTFPASEALTIGFLLMVLGFADIIAGYYLWMRARWAAVTSVVVTSIAGGVIGGYLIILALAGAFLYAYVISAIIKIGAIGFGWRHLKGSRANRAAAQPDQRLRVK